MSLSGRDARGPEERAASVEFSPGPGWTRGTCFSYNAHAPATTIMVQGMASRKLLGMNIDHLRGWAELMDRAVIASLVVAVMAVAALGVTAWLSIRFNGALRTQESAAFDRYKAEADKHMADLQQQAASASKRTGQLQKAMAQATEPPPTPAT